MTALTPTRRQEIEELRSMVTPGKWDVERQDNDDARIVIASDSLLSRDCEKPRTLTRAQLDLMKFDCANNAALSLRVLAELVRTEQVGLDVSRVQGEIIIGVKEKMR